MKALRGLLNDDPQERWTLEDLGMWANGRRGSPIQQAVESRAARSYSFMNKDHYTCRELAQTMSENCDMEINIIFATVHWIPGFAAPWATTPRSMR